MRGGEKRRKNEGERKGDQLVRSAGFWPSLDEPTHVKERERKEKKKGKGENR